MTSIDLHVPEQQLVAAESPQPRHTARAVLISVGQQVAIAAAFIGVAVMLRGSMLSHLAWLNPDEAELIAQARAAMRSPVPFTTWTTTTTGPFWVLFLALLGAVGLPMTIAFAHLLAAVLVGGLGYLGFTLARHWIGWLMSAVLTLFWWMPIVLVLTGHIGDYGALATELLPCALILAAGLLPTQALARRPILYLAAGVVCGLSIGSKYQAAPLVLALVMVQVIRAGDLRWRTLLRSAMLWGAGVLLPLLLVGLAMLLSPDISTTAIRQNLNFLQQYGSGLTLEVRLANWRAIVTTLHVTLLVLVVCWLGTRSAQRIQLCRLILVGGGLAAVFAGGNGFGHYAFFVYTAIVLAIALPLKPDAQLVPYVPRRQPSVAAVIVGVILLAGWFVSFGPPKEVANLSGRHDLTVALSKDSVQRLPSLVEACPVGSRVLIWGWAGEFYVNYGWTNAIPFMNLKQITSSPKNYASGYELTRKAAEDPATDCVMDAVGAPFFSFAKDSSLTTVYPQLSGLLAQEYRKDAGAMQCEACTVYVRR